MGSRLRDTVRYLFELFCEVSPGDHAREPYIIRKYPEFYKNEEELKNVPKFTFPCQLENLVVQHYSFVLTSADSKYTFCFCRYDPKANATLVLLSHLPWHDQFYKLLNCIANLLNSPESGELASLLEACRIKPPMPGHTLKVTYNAGQCVFSCQSPENKLPSIPENCNLTEYFSAMDAKCMAGLWAALLHERRVAIVASKPSRLSACVQAANATLFPMSWQHIFIPILPNHLVDYLLAPIPFLIGVPRCVMETVSTSEIGDVVILDVDINELKTPFHDLESLPSDMVASLKKALSDKNALGDAVSRAFLRALVCLIGGYRDVIRVLLFQLPIVQLLGMELSANLNFGTNNDSKAQTAAKNLGILNSVKRYFTPGQVYKAQVWSCMEYSCNLWDGSAAYQLAALVFLPLDFFYPKQI